VKTSNTIHAENCLHKGMWNGQQYDKTLRVLMRLVNPSRNNIVKLQLGACHYLIFRVCVLFLARFCSRVLFLVNPDCVCGLVLVIL
jgi:hypothetical protein